MITKTRRRFPPADFKRPLQPPFLGAYEIISWASANHMFDIAGDDLEIAMDTRDALRFVGSGEAQRH